MPRYIDWSHVQAKYAEVDKLTDGAVEASSSWISAAEYEIDAYLGKRYSVPFSPAPPLVQDLAIDLTYYKMTARQKGSEKLKAYIDDRIANLIDGDMVISTASGTLLGATGDAATSNTENAVSSFGMDDPLNWSPDGEGVNVSRSLRYWCDD